MTSGIHLPVSQDQYDLGSAAIYHVAKTAMK